MDDDKKGTARKRSGTFQMVTPPLTDKDVSRKTVYARMKTILEQYPFARDTYKGAMYMYWMTFDGLTGAMMGDPDAFWKWFNEQATPPKTLQNRAIDVQRRHPELDASPEVRQWRERQSARGKVNRVKD